MTANDRPTGSGTTPPGERLQRVLAANGVASRRTSEELIRAGRVSVNGRVILEMGVRVNPLHDDIRVDGNPLRRQRPRFILLNKPTGFITTVSDERQRWTVMDLVGVPERVYPVGRLDRDTQGLLLLTNDGTVANRVMHPRYGLAREYHVITARKPTTGQMRHLTEGVIVAGRDVVPDECRLLRETTEGYIVKMVLHEGIYHVVRRMMESVGIVVHRLRRVRLGPLRLQGIPPGSWRDLTPGELVQLYEALGLPVEDAESLNRQRPMQLLPVGGFRHPTSEVPARRNGAPATGVSPAPAGPGGVARSRSGGSSAPRGPARGGPSDGTRSSSSGRDRRTRRGR